MDAQSGHIEALLELEARHDDLLERLEDLDKRVERVLRECAGGAQRALGHESAPT